MEGIRRSPRFSKETNPIVHPKKRQAFSLPKSAAVKAIIKRNETESPLLRLPRELRDKIWSEVLGDQIVHVTCAGGRSTPLTWLAYVYQNPRHDELKQNWEDIPSVQNPLAPDLPLSEHNFGRIYGYIHKDMPLTPPETYENYDLPRDPAPGLVCLQSAESSKPKYKPQLQILRVSRQAYQEANPVLWTSNRFCFCSLYTCIVFLRNRNAVQKRLLRHISLIHKPRDFNLRDGPARKSLTLQEVQGLQGLETLRVHIDVCAFLHLPSSMRDKPDDVLLSSRMDSFQIRMFKALPLKNVEITIRRAYNKIHLVKQEDVRWAKNFASFLQDGDGAQWAAEETAKAEAIYAEKKRVNAERRRAKSKKSVAKPSVRKPRVLSAEAVLRREKHRARMARKSGARLTPGRVQAYIDSFGLSAESGPA